MSVKNLHIGKQFNFLKSLSVAENERLEAHSSIMNIAKGNVVFFENDILEKLFCIQDGACKFSLIDNNGIEHITKLLGKGDLMGRRAIFTNKGALVTATALKNTTLCLIDKKPVLDSMNFNNAFCQDIIKGFISDLEDETEKIGYYQNHSTVKVRLAGLLLYLSDKFGVAADGSISMSLKRQDMASILGTTSEYVISILAAFKQKEYLILKREKIKILSHKKLSAIVKMT